MYFLGRAGLGLAYVLVSPRVLNLDFKFWSASVWVLCGAAQPLQMSRGLEVGLLEEKGQRPLGLNA